MRAPPTAARVRELLHYNPNTGLLAWRKSGQRAGWLERHNDGQRESRRLEIDGVAVYAAQAVVLYVTSKWPTDRVAFRNGDTMDMRWSNLVVATTGEIQQNRHHFQRNNTSGFPGVTRVRGRFQAQIKVERRFIFLGIFEEPEPAFLTYSLVKLAMHAPLPKAVHDGYDPRKG